MRDSPETNEDTIVNYSTLRPLSHRNKIGDKFGDLTTVTV